MNLDSFIVSFSRGDTLSVLCERSVSTEAVYPHRLHTSLASNGALDGLTMALPYISASRRTRACRGEVSGCTSRACSLECGADCGCAVAALLEIDERMFGGRSMLPETRVWTVASCTDGYFGNIAAVSSGPDHTDCEQSCAYCDDRNKADQRLSEIETSAMADTDGSGDAPPAIVGSRVVESVNGVLQAAASQPTTGNSMAGLLAELREQKAQKKQDDVQLDDIKDGTDFISFDFGDEDGGAPQEDTARNGDNSRDVGNDDGAASDSGSGDGDGNAFAKVGEKLSNFIQNVGTVGKQKSSKRQRDAADQRESTSKKQKTKDRRAGKSSADGPGDADLAEGPYPWLHGKSYAREDEPARILHHELRDFVEYLSPSESEHAMRRYVIGRIRRVLKKHWPTASLHVFGSFETKLYLPTSDIDLVVLSENADDAYERVGHLRKLASWLVKEGIATDVQVISGARVPIIKFVDIRSRINVDISFNKPGGVLAAEVVKKFMHDMPALRPLVIFIKHFLGMRGLNEVYLGGLGSYSIICLCVSFLQLHPKLASGQIAQADNLGVLLVEALELYGKRFNYDSVGICIRGRGAYFDKYSSGLFSGKQNFLLCIEDPTDATNDIAKSSFGILKVKSTLAGCHDFLVQRMYDVHDDMVKAPSHGRQSRSKSRHDGGAGAGAAERAILTAVVSIDGEFHERRRKLVKVCRAIDFEDEAAQMKQLADEDARLARRRVPGLDRIDRIADDDGDDDDDDVGAVLGAGPAPQRSRYMAVPDSDEDDDAHVDVDDDDDEDGRSAGNLSAVHSRFDSDDNSFIGHDITVNGAPLPIVRDITGAHSAAAKEEPVKPRNRRERREAARAAAAAAKAAHGKKAEPEVYLVESTDDERAAGGDVNGKLRSSSSSNGGAGAGSGSGVVSAGKDEARGKQASAPLSTHSDSSSNSGDDDDEHARGETSDTDSRAAQVALMPASGARRRMRVRGRKSGPKPLDAWHQDTKAQKATTGPSGGDGVDAGAGTGDGTRSAEEAAGAKSGGGIEPNASADADASDEAIAPGAKPLNRAQRRQFWKAKAAAEADRDHDELGASNGVGKGGGGGGGGRKPISQQMREAAQHD